MEAKTRLSFTTCAFLAVSVILAKGFKFETSHELFLPRSDHGAAGAGPAALRVSSWTSMLDAFSLTGSTPAGTAQQPRQPEEISMARSNRTTLNDVPSNRKGMYFRPVSVTLQCVMLLTISSLLVYTALSLARNYDELNAIFQPSTVTQTLTIAVRVANVAPMLCMLCVACRMYVLATTEGLGEPPAWVKMCMKMGVVGMSIQFIVVICLPVFTKNAAAEEASYDMTEGKMKEFLTKHQATSEPQATSEAEEAKKGKMVRDTGQYTDVHPRLDALEYEETVGFMKYVFWGSQNLGIILLYGSIAGVILGIYTYPVGTTKVSAAVLCTVALSKLYFLTCALLWVGEALPSSEFQVKFKNAVLAMSGATRKFPMFAVLFLAARMRALNLDPPHGMPPFWMQCCFYGITGLVYLETLAAAFVGFNGKMSKAYYGVYMFTCDGYPWIHFLEHLPGIISQLLVIPVIYGVTLMQAADGGPAPLSTTLTCVVGFTVMYGAVSFFQSLILFCEEALHIKRELLRDTFVSAGISLNIAPLLCILFVATRMRALQITQQKGAPPGWAQDCMMIALFATGVQSLCCVVMPLFVASACKFDEDGNPDYDLEPMIGAYAVTIVKYVALIALHGSIIMISIAVYVMTPETAHDGGSFITDRKQFYKMLLITMCVFFVALLLSSAKVVGLAIKIAIEACDEKLLGVNIKIKSCALNVFKGYVKVSKLKVMQPEMEIIYTRNADGMLERNEKGNKLQWKYDFIARVHLVLVKINLWRLITSLGKEFELQNLSLQGMYLNIEKPDTDTKAKNSNIEYILNFIEWKGLLGGPAPKDEKAASSKPEEQNDDYAKFAAAKAAAKKKEDEAAAAKKKKEAEAKNDEGKAKSGIKIIMGKLAIGDMGASVTISNVKLLGEIAFEPSIGLIQFDDIQSEVLGGREDLEGGQVVGYLVKAIAAQVVTKVSHEIPHRLMEAVGLGSGFSGLKESLYKRWQRLKGYHDD